MKFHRFFVHDIPLAGECSLDEGESRHGIQVLRCRIGDRVMAFDGQGAEALCQIIAIARNSIRLGLLERLDSNRELPRELTLFVSLPKGDRQKLLVDMLTQIGTTRLVPLITQLEVAHPVQSALDRLRRTVIEASKQCGRNRLMEVTEPMTVTTLAAESASFPACSIRWVAHPYNELHEFAASHIKPPPNPTSTYLVIGPEGGFTDEEIALLVAAGWSRVTLGQRILRVETAAIAMAASIAQWMESAGLPSAPTRNGP